MRNYKLALILVMFFLQITSYAQDAQLSMFTSSPLELNPATTGFFHNGDFRVLTNYRNQWGSFLEKGIVTGNFSFDAPLKSKKIGLGILIANNSATKGAMNDFSLTFSFAYNTKISKRGGNNLAFGLQAGFKQKSFKPEELMFHNQYEEGLGYNSNLDSREKITETSKSYPDFNAGAMWYVEDPWRSFKPWIGVSAYHLVEPNEAFSSSYDSRLPRKYLAYAGAEIITSKNFKLTPSVLYASQINISQYSVGAHVTITNYKNRNTSSFRTGAYYRSEDAVVAMLGVEVQSFIFLFDYEINISSLKSASSGIGGVELTIMYVKTSSKKRNVKFM